MAIRYLTLAEPSGNSNLRPEGQYRVPVVPPDARPFHRKPRCELDTDGGNQLGLELIRVDPAPGGNLVRIDLDRFGARSDENRAQFVLRARGIKLGLILKFEQELQRACDSQLFLQPPPRGRLHVLAAAGAAAAAVGPVQRPEPLGGGTLLDQELAGSVEDQQRKRSMQAPFALLPSGV